MLGASVFVYSFVAIIMFTLLQARMHENEIGKEGGREGGREEGKKKVGAT